jgi:hypothetical protein
MEEATTAEGKERYNGKNPDKWMNSGVSTF